MKVLVILSNIINHTIKDSLPKTEVLLFRSVNELVKYTENTPIRADAFYITADIFEPTINTNLTTLLELEEHNYFFIANKTYVLYEGEENKVVDSITFIQKEGRLTKWILQRGILNKNYVTNFITGANRTDSFNVRRKNVYRVNKAAYIEEQKKSKRLEEKYATDDMVYDFDEEVSTISSIIYATESIINQITIVGQPEEYRSIFSFLYAQYKALQGKTLILEWDYKFQTLSHIAKSSDVDFLEISIETLLSKPAYALDQIRSTQKNLIVVTANKREHYDYLFLVNYLYANCKEFVKHLIVETDYSEVPDRYAYIVVFRNTLLSVLHMVENIPTGYKQYAKYVAIDTGNLSQLSIDNSTAVSTILSDLLGYEDRPRLSLIRANSLTLRNEILDMGVI